MTARPIRYQRQVSDRKGKIFYTSITSLSHISRCGSDASSRRAKEAHTNKIVQTSRAYDNPYCALFHYSLLLFNLSVSETITQ